MCFSVILQIVLKFKLKIFVVDIIVSKKLQTFTYQTILCGSCSILAKQYVIINHCIPYVFQCVITFATKQATHNNIPTGARVNVKN